MTVPTASGGRTSPKSSTLTDPVSPNTGLPVRPHRSFAFTTLGAGCAQLGNLHRAMTDDEAEATIRAAWDSGIRYFDTAPHYGLGLSERRLGRALAAYPRDEYILSTKVGRVLVPSPETPASGLGGRRNAWRSAGPRERRASHLAHLRRTMAGTLRRRAHHTPVATERHHSLTKDAKEPQTDETSETG
jgi:hypothetical protein